MPGGCNLLIWPEIPAAQPAAPRLNEPDRNLVLTSAKTEAAAPLPQATEISTDTKAAIDAVSRCRQLPEDTRDRTHFIVINGVDPFHIGGVNRFFYSILGGGVNKVKPISLRGFPGGERENKTPPPTAPGAKN